MRVCASYHSAVIADTEIKIPNLNEPNYIVGYISLCSRLILRNKLVKGPELSYGKKN